MPNETEKRNKKIILEDNYNHISFKTYYNIDLHTSL